MPALAALAAAAVLGQCSPAFDPTVIRWPAQTSIGASVAADFDGDGRIDLAETLAAPGNALFIHWGLGDGAFEAPVLLGPASPACLASADFDRDGRPDLVVGVPGALRNLRVLTSHADRTFAPQPAVNFGTGSGIVFLIAADLDEDGRPDAVALTRNTSALLLARGGGDGTLSAGPVAPFTAPGGQDPLAVHALRVDAVPGLELAIPSTFGSSSSVLLARFISWQTPPTFYARRDLAMACQAPFVADLNADHLDDLLLGVSAANGGVLVLPGSVAGDFAPERLFTDSRAMPVALGVADFDGDGDPDVVSTNQTFRLWRNNGEGGLSPTFYPYLSAGFTTLAIADFNRDGRPDLALTGAGSANGATILNTGPLAPVRPLADPVQACPRRTAVARVSSPSTALSWQFLSPQGWRPIAESDDISNTAGALFAHASGAATDSLLLDLLPGASGPAIVRCLASNNCGTTLGPPIRVLLCRPDVNCDGFLDFFDYDDFVAAYLAGDASADFNADGFLDFFDYDDFVAGYEVGC